MSIKKYVVILSVFMCFASNIIGFTEKRYTIMLDPAGDARQTGRTIGANFERAITLQIAQALQTALQSTLPCTVIITRTAGEAVPPLQNANFANRLSPDLYISLHCYHTPQEKHTVAIYYVSHGTTFVTKQPDLAMVPLAQAHLSSGITTKKYAESIYRTLLTDHAHQFQLPLVATVPFVPLTGIQVPALGIEINCLSPDNINLYVEPLAKAIMHALTT